MRHVGTLVTFEQPKKNDQAHIGLTIDLYETRHTKMARNSGRPIHLCATRQELLQWNFGRRSFRFGFQGKSKTEKTLLNALRPAPACPARGHMFRRSQRAGANRGKFSEAGWRPILPGVLLAKSSVRNGDGSKARLFPVNITILTQMD